MKAPVCAFLAMVLTTSVIHAKNTTAPSSNLREKALAEYTQNSGMTSSSATDAQTTGMLTLKDPHAEIINRSWKYFMGVSVQEFQASGIAQKDQNIFDLDANGSSAMPFLEFGILSSPWVWNSFALKLGLRAEGGFTSQSVDVTLASGFNVDDVRLNSALLSAGPMIVAQWQKIPWLSLQFTPQVGSLNYTQTSANEFATFSKHANFQSMSYGLDFAVSKKWSVFTEWTQRNLNNTQDIALQQDNYELGTKVTW